MASFFEGKTVNIIYIYIADGVDWHMRQYSRVNDVLAKYAKVLPSARFIGGSFRGKNSSYVWNFSVGKTLDLRAF